MNLLPPSTNGAYRGARVSAWFLALAAALAIGPGLLHSFLPDGGAHSIAGLDLGDRRDVVVGVFRWVGATQLAFGLAMLAVALRYRPLAPLFLALLLLEQALVALHDWALSPPASGRHPPGDYGSLVVGVSSALFLVLSLRTSERPKT